MARCNVCGIQNSVKYCCSITLRDEQIKNELKLRYKMKAGNYATQVGFENFVWKHLVSLTSIESDYYSLISSIEKDPKALNEKDKIIFNLSNKFDEKYKPIIEEKDREIDQQKKLIKKLQVMVAPNYSENETPDQKNSLACNQCGSVKGCYCT